MSGETYYVWSPIPKEIVEQTGVIKTTYKVGETVSQADLGIGDDDWNYMIQVGSVRTTPYPEPLTGDVRDPRSPTQFIRELVVKAGEGRATQEDLNNLGKYGAAITPEGYTPTDSIPLPAGVEVPEDIKQTPAAPSGSSKADSGKES